MAADGPKNFPELKHAILSFLKPGEHLEDFIRCDSNKWDSATPVHVLALTNVNLREITFGGTKWSGFFSTGNRIGLLPCIGQSTLSLRVISKVEADSISPIWMGRGLRIRVYFEGRKESHDTPYVEEASEFLIKLEKAIARDNTVGGAFRESARVAEFNASCTHCRRANPAGAKFCGTCGEPLTADAHRAPAATNSQATPPASGTVPSKANAVAGCGCLVLIVVVVLMVITSIFGTQKDNRAAAPPQNSPMKEDTASPSEESPSTDEFLSRLREIKTPSDLTREGIYKIGYGDGYFLGASFGQDGKMPTKEFVSETARLTFADKYSGRSSLPDYAAEEYNRGFADGVAKGYAEATHTHNF